MDKIKKQACLIFNVTTQQIDLDIPNILTTVLFKMDGDRKWIPKDLVEIEFNRELRIRCEKYGVELNKIFNISFDELISNCK